MSTELSVFQEIAVNRVTNYCNNLEGILLMHEVGTGKTITSLAMGINSIDWSLKIGDETINTIDELECVNNEYDEINYIFTGKPHKGGLKFGGETNNNYLGPDERNNCEIEFITKNPGRVIVILHPTGLFGNFSDEINKFDRNVVEMDIARWDTIFRGKPFVNSNVFNHLMKTANYPDETVCRLRRKFVKITEIDGQRIERTYWKTFYIISRIYKHIKGSFFRSLPIVGMGEMQNYLKGRILIIDEAHRLLNPIMATGPSMIDYILSYNGCSTCRKIIAMSGTPIKSNILDLVRMIQFVTQKDYNVSNRFNLNLKQILEMYKPDYKKFESAAITALAKKDISTIKDTFALLFMCGKQLAKKIGSSVIELVNKLSPINLSDMYFQESITKIIVYNNALYYKYMWYLQIPMFTRTYFVGKNLSNVYYNMFYGNTEANLLTMDNNYAEMIDINNLKGGNKMGFLRKYTLKNGVNNININENDTKIHRIDNFYERTQTNININLDKDLDSIYALIEDDKDYLRDYYAIKNDRNRESKKFVMVECRKIIEKYALHYPVNYENLYKNVNKYISFISAEMPIISKIDISEYNQQKKEIESELLDNKNKLKIEQIKKEVFDRIIRKQDLLNQITELEVKKNEIQRQLEINGSTPRARGRDPRVIEIDNSIRDLESDMNGSTPRARGRDPRVIEIDNSIRDLKSDMNSIGLRDLKDLFPQQPEATPFPNYLSSVLQSPGGENPINFSPTYVKQFNADYINEVLRECNEKILELQSKINISKDKINEYKKRTGDYVDKYLNDPSTKVRLKEIDKSIRYVYPQKVVEIIYTPYVWEQTYFYHRINKQIVSKLEAKSDYQPHIPWYMIEDEWKDTNLMKRCASNYSLDVDYKAIKYNIEKNEYEYYIDTHGEEWYDPEGKPFNGGFYPINKVENNLTYSCPKFEKILAMLFINKFGLNYNYDTPDEEGNKTIKAHKTKKLVLNKILTKQAHFIDGNSIYLDSNNKRALNDKVFEAFVDDDLDTKTAKTLSEYNKTTIDKTDKDNTSNRLKKLNSKDYDDNRTHCFLPLVYSTSDVIGLNLFAAFLKKKKINYIILHDDAKKNNLELMKTLSFSAAYPRFNLNSTKQEYTPDKILSHLVKCLQENVKIEEGVMKTLIRSLNKRPLCILLHPLMTEGLDAKYNPAIYLLESPKMYSDYDQLCGRVLRTIRPGYEKKKIKNVYQCLGYTHAGVTDLMNEYFSEIVDYKLSSVGTVSHAISDMVTKFKNMGTIRKGGNNTKKNKPTYKNARFSRKYIGGDDLKTKDFSVNEGQHTRYHLDDDIASVTTLFFDVKNNITERYESDRNSYKSGALTLVYFRELSGSFKEYNFLKPKDNLFMTIEPNLIVNAYSQHKDELDESHKSKYEHVINYILWTDYVRRTLSRRINKLFDAAIDVARIYVEICVVTAIGTNIFPLFSTIISGINMGIRNTYNLKSLKLITDTLGTGIDIVKIICGSSMSVAFDISLFTGTGIWGKFQTYIILRQNMGIFSSITSVAALNFNYTDFIAFLSNQGVIDAIRSLSNMDINSYMINMQMINGFFNTLSTVTSVFKSFDIFSLSSLKLQNITTILTEISSKANLWIRSYNGEYIGKINKVIETIYNNKIYLIEKSNEILYFTNQKVGEIAKLLQIKYDETSGKIIEFIGSNYNYYITIFKSSVNKGTEAINSMNLPKVPFNEEILPRAPPSYGGMQHMVGGERQNMIEYLIELNEYVGFQNGKISIDEICKYYFNIDQNVNIEINNEEPKEYMNDNEGKLLNYPSKYIMNATNFEKVNINMFKNIIKILFFQKTFIMTILKYINLVNQNDTEIALKREMENNREIGIYFSKNDKLINMFNNIEYDKMKRDYEIILTDNYIFLKYGIEPNNSYEDTPINRNINQLTNTKLCVIYTIMNIVSSSELTNIKLNISEYSNMLTTKYSLIESAIRNGIEILINDELSIVNNRITKILKPIIEREMKKEEEANAYEEYLYNDDFSYNIRPERKSSSISEEDFNNIITTLNNDNTRDANLINNLLNETQNYIKKNIIENVEKKKEKDEEKLEISELSAPIEIKQTPSELSEALTFERENHAQYEIDILEDLKTKIVENIEQEGGNKQVGGYRTNENWLYNCLDKLRTWTNLKSGKTRSWVSDFKYVYTIYTSYGFPYISKHHPSLTSTNRNKYQQDFIDFIKYKLIDIYTSQFNITNLNYNDGDINALIDEIPSPKEIGNININEMRDDLHFFINICKNEYHYNKIKDMIKNEAEYPYIQDIVAIKECGNNTVPWCNPLTNDSSKICTNNTGINQISIPSSQQSAERSAEQSEQPSYTHNGNNYYGDIGNTNLPNGQGRMIYKNGDEFEGTWVNNKKQKGIYRYQDGDSSQGNWVYDGKKDVRDGKHKYTKIWGPSEFGGFVDDRISETVHYLYFDKGTIIGTYKTAEDPVFTRLAPGLGRAWVLATGFHGGKTSTRKHKGGKKSKRHGKNKKHGRTKYKRTNKKTRKLQK